MKRPPKYCHHKAKGLAYVRHEGRMIYLGEYGSKESMDAYARVLAEGAPRPAQALTVGSLLEAYLAWAAPYYSRDQLKRIRLASQELERLYKALPVADFGPNRLRAIMQVWISHGYSRTTINSWKGCIQRIFKWGVSRELLQEQIYRALATVENLHRGKTAAAEPEPVLAVSREMVDKIREHCTRQIWGMVELQWYTGMRPGEVCIIRPCDIDATGEVWRYTPHTHKTQHLGKGRAIFLGPQAQAILRPWLVRHSDAYCFSPSEAKEERLQASTSPRRPTQAPTPRKTQRRQNTTEHYTPSVYACAVARACLKAGIARWSPNQLRHARATYVCDTFGIEAASKMLGHARVDTTGIYTKRAEELAKMVALQIG